MADRKGSTTTNKEVAPSKEPVVRLLDDLPVNKDAFGGHHRIADAIAHLIETEAGGKAIALEGSWGSGKSSVVQMLSAQLAKAGRSLFTFDAWAHEGDPLRRAFLQTLTNHCIASNSSDSGFKDRWDAKLTRLVGTRKKDRSRQRPRISRLTPLILALIAIYPIALLAARPILNRDPDLGQWFPVVVTLLLVPVMVLLVFWIILGSVKHRSKLARQIGRILTFWMNKTVVSNETTTHSSPETSSIEFEQYFSQLMKEAVPAETRLVIVLDNLDRVPSETAEAVWSTIRLFADTIERRSANEDWTTRVWMLVPYDRDGASSVWRAGSVRAISEREPAPGKVNPTDSEESTSTSTKAKAPSIAAAFLDKTFQIRFVVPPLHVADWEIYLQELIETAMPGFGSIEVRHRVHRLSERVAEEKRRPPSPRHLKLYVNDIGALVRQFGDCFPIDHLALYSILRRQGEDIRLWILHRDFEKDPLAQVMPDETYVHSLLAMYYGTTNKEHARTLLLRGPLRKELRAGNGEGLKQLAALPGFWAVAETEFEAEFEEEDRKQELVANFATALETSGLAMCAPTPYQHVIPKFAQKLLVNANWVHLNMKSAVAAGQLLKIVRDPAQTARTLQQLVSGVGLDAEAFNAADWATGSEHLFEVVASLQHDWEARLAHSADQAVAILVALAVLEPTRVLETLNYGAEPSLILDTIKPSATYVWSRDHYLAVGALLRTPHIQTPWSDMVDAIAARLRADDVKTAEAHLLWERFFDAYDRSSTSEIPPTIKKAVNRPRFYTLLHESATDPVVIAASIAVMLLTDQVGRSVSDGSEQPGFDLLKSFYKAPEDRRDILDAFVEIVKKHPHTRFIGLVIENRARLGMFPKALLHHSDIESNLGGLINVRDVFEHFDAFREVLDSQFISTIQGALASDEFSQNVDDHDIVLEQAGVHVTLIDAGVLKRPTYRERLFDKLAEVEQSAWEAELLMPGDLYALLGKAVESGYNRLHQVADAFEQVGLSLVSDAPPESAWDVAPPSWETLYSRLSPERRQTAAHKIIHRLTQDKLESLRRLMGLFGGELIRAFSESKELSLVREVATPLVNGGDPEFVDWLRAGWERKRVSWDAAPEEDRGTFTQILQERLQTVAPAEAEALRKLARILAIPEFPPASESGSDMPD